MVAKLFIISALYLLVCKIQLAIGLSCSPCKQHNWMRVSKVVACKPVRNCKGGLAKSLCGCCDVCAKVKGEECGGIFGIKGACDKRLKCVRKYPHSMTAGVCSPVSPRRRRKSRKKFRLRFTKSFANHGRNFGYGARHFRKRHSRRRYNRYNNRYNRRNSNNNNNTLIEIKEKIIIRKALLWKRYSSESNELDLTTYGVPLNYIDDAVNLDSNDVV